MTANEGAELPIGVFDSGVGGLTVLRALRERLPFESFVYLGDTARLPYGTKSASTVLRYSEQAARALVSHRIKLLVVACNTASAVAIEHLSELLAPLPVVGVVEPGAEAACKASRRGRIVVIATEGTIAGGAYDRAIARLRPDAHVTGRACPLFVALAEEGWTDGAIPEAIARAYVSDVFVETGADCLVLGCTHFPALAAPLARVVGPAVALVDSAVTTAERVAVLLAEHGIARDGSRGAAAAVRLLATDGRDRFARVGGRFLGVDLDPAAIDLVDL
jgi:glutamate racemase